MTTQLVECSNYKCSHNKKYQAGLQIARLSASEVVNSDFRTTWNTVPYECSLSTVHLVVSCGRSTDNVPTLVCKEMDGL